MTETSDRLEPRKGAIALPWTLWISLLLLGVEAVATVWAATEGRPAWLIAGIASVGLGIGLAFRKRWAFTAVLAAPALGGGIAAGWFGAVPGLLVFAGGVAVAAPVALCKWWFFPPTGLESVRYQEGPNPDRTRQMAYLLMALLLLLGGSRLLPPTLALREEHQLGLNPATEGVPPKVALATTALGGFRGIFIDVLWLRTMKMKEEGRFFEMVQLYDWITNLQPHYSKVWAFAAWDVAYNVSVQHDNLMDRWFWVYRGIRYLRNKGIPYNQNDPELYMELAWIFHHKVGDSTDYAHRIYRTRLAEIYQVLLGGRGTKGFLARLTGAPETEAALRQNQLVASLASELSDHGYDILNDFKELQSDFPDLEEGLRARLQSPEGQVAMETVAMFRIKKTLREEHNMEPAKMLALNERFGPLDWRGADAHALYWAWEARKIRYRQLEHREQVQGLDYEIFDIRFERYPYFVLQDMVQRGRISITSDGYVYDVPDYRFLRPLIEYLGDLIDRAERSRDTDGDKVNLAGTRSGYENAIKHAIITYYMHDQIADADEFLALLREEFPKKSQYHVSVNRFVQSYFKTWVGGMTTERYHGVVLAHLKQHFRHLAMGDPETAAEYDARARNFYRYAKRRWVDKPQEGEMDFRYVTPLSEMRADLLVDILEGRRAGFTPDMRERLVRILPRALLESARKRALRREEQPGVGAAPFVGPDG
jgi:hypothetical protein